METLISEFPKWKRFVVTAHRRPDGDAAGSALAMRNFLSRFGEAIVALDKNDLGPSAALEGAENVVPPENVALDENTLLVVLDCATKERCPVTPRGKIVLIDHHATCERFGDLNWVDPASGSCGEMILRLAQAADWTIDRASAAALWVAIATDTGCFTFEKTTPATMRAVATLLECGANPDILGIQQFRSTPWKVMELRRRAWQTLERHFGGKLITIETREKDFLETGCRKTDDHEIVKIPISVEGALVGVMFYEVGGKTFISIRTKEGADATEIAGWFGGGGHKRAAGCSVEKPLADAKNDFLARIEKFLTPDI